MLRTTVLSAVAAIALPLALSASAVAAPDSTGKLPKSPVVASAAQTNAAQSRLPVLADDCCPRLHERIVLVQNNAARGRRDGDGLLRLGNLLRHRLTAERGVLAHGGPHPGGQGAPTRA